MHTIISWCRRAKRRAQQKADTASDRDDDEPTSARPPETEAHGATDSDIEAKLATVEDQKEAKRLKRSVWRVAHNIPRVVSADSY